MRSHSLGLMVAFAAALVAAALFAETLPALGSGCYEDVIVTGAGCPWANGHFAFGGMSSGHPVFEATWSDGVFDYTVQMFYGDGDPIWYLVAGKHIDSSTYCIVVYATDEVSATPPSSGWYLEWTAGCLCAGEGLPVPGISGGGSSDDTPPVLSVPADTTIECDGSDHPDDTGWATATDTCDPDPVVTYSDQYGFGAMGLVLRTWRAEDASGNVAEEIQNIWITCPNVVVTSVAPLWLTSLPGDVSLSFTIEKCAEDGAFYVHEIGWSDWQPVIAGGPLNTLSLSVPPGVAEGLHDIAHLVLRRSSAHRHMVADAYVAGCCFGVDLTAPTFIDCPMNLVVDAPAGSAWATVDWIEPIADDAISGMDTLLSTHASGDTFPLGTTTVTYTATDVAGNSSSCSFDITVNATCNVITPMGNAGFLDRGWPEGEEAPVIGELPLIAEYAVGEQVKGCFSICSLTGEAVDEPVILTYYAVTEIGEDFDVRLPLNAQYLYFDHDLGMYCFAIETDDLTPGYYDIRLGFPDDQVQWLRIELIALSE